MGVMWLVFTLDEQIRVWLNETGIVYPDVPSRFPTGREIKDVIATLSDYDVWINDKNGIGSVWQATVFSKSGGDTEDWEEWALLNVSEYTGDDEPQELLFEKGCESLIVRILDQLSKSTGPLVLVNDAGDDPMIIWHAT